MDASASKVDAEVGNLFGLYLKIENASYPPTIKQKKTVIKYTKLPDDINAKAPWLCQGHILEPRFRRIITIEEPKISTRRSLKSDVAVPSTIMAADVCKRKIVTIEDDEYNNYYPKYSHQIKKSFKKVINRAVEAKEEKLISPQKLSGLPYSSKSSKDVKSNVTRASRSSRSINSPSKYSLNKKKSTRESEKEVPVTKNKLKEECVTKLPPKKVTVNKTTVERTRLRKSPNELNQNNKALLKDIKLKYKPIPVIHVPLDETLLNCDVSTEVSEDICNLAEIKSHKVNSSFQVTNTKFNDIHIGTQNSVEYGTEVLLSEMKQGTEISLKKVEQGTEVLVNKVDQATEVLLTKVDKETEVDQDFIENEYDLKKTFDSLDIPNVSLINSNKSDVPKDDIVDIINSQQSVVINKDPHILDIPMNVISQKDETDFRESQLHNNSYIISRATLTYTTKQKINFHVVGNNELLQAHAPSSRFKYPMNVVSVYKNELKNQEYQGACRKLYYDRNDENDKSHDELEHLKNSTSVDCSNVFINDKLVKPSDIISTIKVNNSLVQSDYICEQFQRELNFIDSFFESLQYLESCSLSDKCVDEKEVENWINNSGNELKHLEFGSFLSKFENEINIDDSKTMASKSLCLLNLLIRDEQRRAKNLLFVLKMREDALKDFTKSQILWLENKKKQENTDISQLKKKQRGALLKLQHECGEMQRMRKALLTLSEKRKLALMKTKKNIEIKLKNSVDVEQIILGKKKLKRSPSSDRNVAPLKCFELSSSGCDDSTTSRPRSTTSVLLPSIPKRITSAEKCVQTSEGTLDRVCMDCSTDTADENFIVVDGGYLNILFQNLSPQIFSSEKQYEVNKEALNNIVHTSNVQRFNWKNDIAIEELMDKIKNRDLEGTNTPSTARSLVDEFDQIYKGLAEDKSYDDSTDHIISGVIDEISGVAPQIVVSQADDSKNDQKSFLQESSDDAGNKSSNNSSTDESCNCEPLMIAAETQLSRGNDIVSVAGPLPVPAGAAAVPDDVPVDVPTWLTQKPSTSSSLVDSSTSSSQQVFPSVSSLTPPVLFEAEELRRQQLAIEREIKALEQQQCQLLAVREIPDKPPPPYTPPSEPKAPKPLGKFTVDHTIEDKLRTFFPDPKNDEVDLVDPFDVFVKDFCLDSTERHKLEKNQKYWDTCNFPPSKPELNTEKLIARTTLELKEVLTSVPPTVVSGVGARRSDHIDDILFAEWRRCEPEWTSLHADEVIVKNQVFESIFQKILSETVDEYKRTVLEPNKS
ncbi:uncharacterized protein LOC123880637 isoform X2 [Maniola jurtina]|uniref:uncharacterized protein LOC123880637 isoform X2 n=1 Tax=Maniola jurtina TaxID=191418 RepID=UPI001E68BD36|nr:uncharacterized protein LOC123880637 isoform X2 [Maniola jurtina]